MVDSYSNPFEHAPNSTEFQRLRRRLTRKVTDAIAQFNLIEAGDHVLVCCSGGKDSYAMLSILTDLTRRGDIKFSITAFNLDQGQPGFPMQTLPDYFDARNVPWHVETQDTYSIVKSKIPEGKTTCGLCSRLRRGIIYESATALGATKIALGHHREDVIETLFLNLFFGARLKAMPPKLSALNGQHTLIRPLFLCAEPDLARFARAMSYPIIPCNLCGAQENLQRQKIKDMLTQWERDFPGRKEAILSACQTVVPSHLADSDLFNFSTFDEKHPESTRPADIFAEALTRPRGFDALLS